MRGSGRVRHNASSVGRVLSAKATDTPLGLCEGLEDEAAKGLLGSRSRKGPQVFENRIGLRVGYFRDQLIAAPLKLVHRAYSTQGAPLKQC
jgi:hypothetical protein